MSTVDKMLIKGIRSFDPENKHVITFFKPLTLIVGPNGAGKTTIIECLKLSCSGELPPNARSGHSFIHDPKVAGETETKAQIKLRFRTAAGKDVVCIRSFQLTQKASKMEFKAIDSVLQTINPHTGEKVCLSYRCADMDREIPALMGVSKAILENVIFVHQDEANWPLQDPSTLKKKFDDIFSATRYTKALEVIKKLHKDQAQEIKTYKLKLENLQTLKDVAYKLRESISKDQEKTESVKSQMQELEGSIRDVDTKIRHTEATLKDLRELQDQISMKTAVRSTLFKEQQKKYADLAEENEDTDEELKEWKTKFEERIAILETKISKLEREMEDTGTKSGVLKKTLEKSIWEISKLQTEAEVHRSSKSERDSIIQNFFTRHNLGSLPNPPFDDEVALNLTNRIKSRLLELEKDLQDKKKSNEFELKTAWDRYMDASGRWNNNEAQKKAKKDIKNGLLKRIKEKENERDSFELQVSNVDLSHIDEKEKNMSIEVERKKNQLARREFESTIIQKESELYSIGQMIKVADREKSILDLDSEDRVKLSIKKTELENLKKKHRKIIDEYKDRIRGMLKGRLPPEHSLNSPPFSLLLLLLLHFLSFSLLFQFLSFQSNQNNTKTNSQTQQQNPAAKEEEDDELGFSETKAKPENNTHPLKFNMKLRAPDHHLRHHHSALFFSIFLSLISLSLTPLHALQTVTAIQRRILHQPLFPDSSSPPPEIESPPIPPPPPPDVSSDPTDQPFFHELPSGSTPDQPQSPPPPSNATVPIPQASQPTKGTKRVAIAASVGIVTLGMLSALAFFLYRHRVKHPSESEKLVNGGGPGSQRFADDSRIPPSSFLYIGTVEPSRTSTTSSEAVSGPTTAELNRSPYHRLNSVKRSDRYRPSPELQPLPPLSKPPQNLNSPSPVSSSDEESHETAFHSPNCSSISYDDSYYTPRQGSVNGGANCAPIHVANSIPHSKRTSPKSRLSVSSTTRNQVAPPPPPPPPPPPMPIQTQARDAQQRAPTYSHKRPKFSSPPPPPPNLARVSRAPVPPPPPPPPSRPPILRQQEVGDSETVTKVSAMSAQVSAKTQSSASIPIGSFENGTRKTAEPVADESLVSSESFEADDAGGAKPKLKPLHWDKVRATSDRATVWDQLKSSSFQLNEDMMETLFGCNSANSVPKAKEPIRRSVLPPVEQENRVLDPKKSQNIAILLRALNVARDEVTDSLLDGNPEGLGAELLETLVKMAPTKEEEIKLRDYQGDVSKLGTAERFLKAVLDIPFAFKRVEAMLYRANFNTEVKYLRKSFQTLEEASEELKNSRLFLKLLEAVLRTGNRMNVGTNRGDAKSFKLDTLLKLVDIKGTDGKTTLLHFVVQEIIRSEGSVVDSTNEDAKKMPINAKEDDFKKQGLQIVAGLGRDLSNVKNAAGMDSDVLSGYVSKLEMGLEKVKLVLQYEKPDMQGKFFNSMKIFLKEAEEEILRIKADERKALYMVKEVTEYFHGDTAKEEAHPFRIFMIVRDFLNVLDQVCKEVGRMQDRTLVGSARSFRIAATASLPVLNRYNVRQDNSSDDESLSP